MVTKKDLVVAVLATFCLTATLFVVVPTRSQDSRYNAWIDTNDDGLINIMDITQIATAFGASGDPTKSVNITGHASKLTKHHDIILNTDQTWTTMNFPVDGYTKLNININVMPGVADGIDCYLVAYDALSLGSYFVVDVQAIKYNAEYLTNFLVKSYDVMNTFYRINIRNTSGTQVTLDLDIYLVA